MARFNHIKNSLNGGEWSRSMAGRTDVEKYGDSVQKMENFIPLAQGGAIHRPGTKFVNEAYDETNIESRLMPFVFNVEQAYIIEFARNTNFSPMGRARFYREKARIGYTSQQFTDAEVNIATEELEISNTGTNGHYLMRRHGSAGSNGGRFDITLVSGASLPTASATLTNLMIRLPVEEDFTIDFANNRIDTGTTHNYTTGQGPFKVRTTGAFSSDGTDGELDTNTEYYVTVHSTTSLRLYPTSAEAITDAGTGAGNQIAMTLAGSGTHTIYPTKEYTRTKFQVENNLGTLITFSATGSGTFQIEAQDPQPASTVVAAEIGIPYLEAELTDVTYAQSADVIYLAHPNHPPAKIGRLGHGEWVYDEAEILDGPYFDEHIGEVTDDTEITINGTFSGPPDPDYWNDRKSIQITTGTGFFKSSDIGRHVRLKTSAGVWTWGIIKEFVSSVLVNVDFKEETAAGICENWRLGAWGGGTDTGYPSHVSFFEQRLAWGNYAAAPNGFHASKVADFENMAPTAYDANGTVVENDSLSYLLGANSVDAIRWMKPTRALVLGTTDSVWPMVATNLNEPITPFGIQAKPSSTTGSADVTAVIVEDVIIYLTRTGRQVMGINYAFERDAYVGEQFDIASETMTNSGIKQIARQLEPFKNVWFLRNDGILACMTYMREHRVRAWHKHIIGGKRGSAPNETHAEVKSIAVIPAQDGVETGNHDQLWMVVQRKIDGGDRYFIEVMEEPFWDEDIPVEDAWFVDSGVELSGGDISGTIATGLDHLEGQVVVGLYDGSYLGSRLVQAGAISLPVSGVTKVIVGLYADADIKLWPPDVTGKQGTSEGNQKLIDAVTLRLQDTIGGQCGSDEDNLDPMMTEILEAFDTAPDLYNDDFKVEIDHDWDDRPEVYIRQDKPYPMTVLAVITRVRASER